MPQSIDVREVHVDQPLRNISIAYRNLDYIWGSIFPMVPVGKSSDLYYLYNQPEWFRDEAGLRAPGAWAKYGQWGTGTARYSTQEYAFDALLPDQVRANSDEGIDPERTSIEYATDKVLLNTELRVAALVQTAANWSTTVAAPYKWDDYDNSDPQDDVKARRQVIRTATGKNPNTLVLSERVLEALEDHPLIVEKLPLNVPQFVDPTFLARVFKVERIVVGRAIYTTSPEGTATPTYADIWNDNVWLGYVAPRPELRMPSAGYVFQWQPNIVKRFRDDRGETDIFGSRINQDEKVVSSICGATITDVLP